MPQTTTETTTVPASDSLSVVEQGDILDTEGLAVQLFAKLVAAQADLMRARSARDHRAADERLLSMRAAALLMACLPAHPDSDAFRLKTCATVALREEDGDEASHAWLMCERALVLDRQRHSEPDNIG